MKKIRVGLLLATAWTLSLFLAIKIQTAGRGKATVGPAGLPVANPEMTQLQAKLVAAESRLRAANSDTAVLLGEAQRALVKNGGGGKDQVRIHLTGFLCASVSPWFKKSGSVNCRGRTAHPIDHGSHGWAQIKSFNPFGQDRWFVSVEIRVIRGKTFLADSVAG